MTHTQHNHAALPVIHLVQIVVAHWSGRMRVDACRKSTRQEERVGDGVGVTEMSEAAASK